MTQTSDWRPLYPFASHEFDLDGRRMHYVDEGAGPVLLLVHGNPTWSFYYRALISALRDRYRVIAPDHIGCGLSDKPDAGEYPFTLEQRIEDLKRLIAERKLDAITLIAHDWGGAIGMGAAVDLPERFARFVLMNTAAFPGGRCPLRIRVCRTPLLGEWGVKGLNLFARAALRMAVHRRPSLDGPVARGLVAPYDSWRNRTAVHQFVVDIPLHKRHRSYQRLERIERGLAQFRDRPICLPWGMRDWCFTPDFLARFQAIFPSAEAHPIDDAGHYVLEDAPEEVVGIVDRFLTSHPLGD